MFHFDGYITPPLLIYFILKHQQCPQMKQISLVLFLLLVYSTIQAPNSYGSSCPAFTPCSCFCSYYMDVNSFSQVNLLSGCSASTMLNGNCNVCDQLLFTLSGQYCVPHLADSQDIHAYYDYATAASMALTVTGSRRQLGFYSAAAANYIGDFVSNMIHIVTGLQAHFAIRIRFGVFFQENTNAGYDYPLTYTMDSSIYSYNMASKNYFSCYDIITSSKITHHNPNLTVRWQNTDSTQPDNSQSCSFCYCRLAGACNSGVTRNCCENRFIEIRDMLVFISRCPTNCLACTSATACTQCDVGFILNYADNLCYSTCPQATYLNSTMYRLGNVVNGTYDGTYVQTFVSYCVSCDPLCLQCFNSTYCTRCYTIGRNESYLFNNTCVRAPCLYGFVANMTNHTCDCPIDYYYFSYTQDLNGDNITLNCTPCAFQCVRCTGSTNLMCSVCQTGFYLANGTTFCLNKCPDGQYIHPYTLTCFLCDISCSTCQASPTFCTSCSSPYYLFLNRCFASCPPGYSWNNISLSCDLCDYYTYSYQGVCLSTCPTWYQNSVQNRSCISYTLTGYSFDLVLEEVHVLSHGKSIQYTIFVSDGLNSTSEAWFKKYSYEGISILYKDARVQPLQGVRSLMNISLAIRNIAYSNNRIKLTTNVPQDLSYKKAFQIVLLSPLYGLHDLQYGNYTNQFSIEQHPTLIKEYYTYAVQSYYQLLALPFLGLCLFLVMTQIRGTYELIVEVLRVGQIMGLLLSSAHPVGPDIFYFLLGWGNCNMDFLPNLYAQFAKTSSASTLNSYALISSDMDFIRLMGSIFLFGILMLVIYLIAKFLLKLKEWRLNLIANLAVDLMEVKIFHSFWTALLYIVVNYRTAQFDMFLLFVLAVWMVAAIIGRSYKAWKGNDNWSPLIFWRCFAPLLICLLSLANELIISLLILLAMSVTMWHFFYLHSSHHYISINDLSSSNYMKERTFRVLNDYDIEVKYSFAISLRNTLISACPSTAAIATAVSILLREAQFYSVYLTTGIVYLLLLLAMITTVLIFNFLEERRRFLVQNKLQYLQKKYAKLGVRDTAIYEQRRRPRVMSSHLDFDEQKYYEVEANRSKMKSFD